MDIYNYSPKNGEYLSTSPARIDPKESKIAGDNVYLIPAHGTELPPPSSQNNEVAVFDTLIGAWRIEPDHRGETWFDDSGQPVTVSEIGDPLDFNLTQNEPVAPPPTKSELHDYAAQKRYEVEVGGIVVNGVNVSTIREHRSLLKDVSEYLADGDTRSFKDSTGTWVSATGLEFKALYAAVEAHIDGCFVTEKTVADKIDADTITTTAEIDAEPWPSNS